MTPHTSLFIKVHITETQFVYVPKIYIYESPNTHKRCLGTTNKCFKDLHLSKRLQNFPTISTTQSSYKSINYYQPNANT